MSTSELPKMVRQFLKLFRGETDDKIKADFNSIDSTMDGHIDLHEFIKVSRVAVYNNFTHSDELIEHLNIFRKEVVSRRSKKHYFSFVLDYKLVDDFTTGTEEENEAFMAKFKGAIKFLDTDLSGKVDLDEIVKLVRDIELMPDDVDDNVPFVKKQSIMRKRESVNLCDGIDLFHMTDEERKEAETGCCHDEEDEETEDEETEDEDA